MRLGGLLAGAVAMGVIAAAFSGGGAIVTEEALNGSGAGGGPLSAASGADGQFASCGGPLARAPGDLKPLFEQAGNEHGVDPQLLAAIASKESQFNPQARNPNSGASGLMQFMPATARGLGVDPFNPAEAVDGAARYVKDLQRQFDTTAEVLAAYNWGPVNVAGRGMDARPAETVDYVTTIEADLRTTEACTGVQAVSAAGASAPVPGAVGAYMGWAQSKVGGPYVFGGNGPVGFDCSSFVLTALKQAGVNGMPRTAAAQDAWCSAGNCEAVPLGQERKGDIFVWDSYLGKSTVGHIGFINDPARKTTTDARSTSEGIINGSYAHHGEKSIFRIWRPKL